jgi:predicted MFS family arabinose efflux permease
MAPLLREDLHLSAGQFGWFVSAYYGAQIVCAFPAGALADRIGVGRSLIVAMLILASGAVALSMVSSMPLALTAMALMGVGYSIVNPASARGVLNWIPNNYRATAMGFKQTGVPLGGVFAALSGVLATVFGWRIMMLFAAVSAVATIGLLLPLLRIPRKSVGRGPLLPWQDLKRVIGDANIRVFGKANTLLQIGQGNFFAFLTLFLRDAGQTSQSFASLCLGVAQLASTVGRIGWGVLCDRMFQHRRTTLVTMITAVAAISLLAMVLITPTNVHVLALLLSAILGVTIASFAGMTLTIASEASPPERAATTVGFNLMMVSFGGVIGPPIFGYAMDHLGGYNAGWIVTGVSVFGAVYLLRYVFVEGRGRVDNT